MRLLATSKPDPATIQPGDQILCCPDCGSDRPWASIILLRNGVRRGEQIIGIVTGERVACQNCPCVYSYDRHGIFRHHARSLPLSPSVPVAAPAEAQRDNGTNEPPRPMPLIPRERPVTP